MHSKLLNRAGNRTFLAVVLALGGVAAPQAMAQTYYDLTGATPGSAIINGAYIFPNLGAPYVSGSGVFNSFLRVQNNPQEQGYNAGLSGALMTDAKSGVSLQPNALTRPAPGSSIGTNFFTFALDINEQAIQGQAYISLDEISIYGSAVNMDTALSGQGTDAAKLNYLRTNGSLIWSNDGTNPGAPLPADNTTVLLDYNTVSSGSGKADVLFVVPTSFFPSAISGNTNYFLYFFTRLGYTGIYLSRDFSTDAGFEEWNTVSGLTINPPPLIPEPSTWAGGGVAAVATAGWVWRRRRQQAKAEVRG